MSALRDWLDNLASSIPPSSVGAAIYIYMTRDGESLKAIIINGIIKLVIASIWSFYTTDIIIDFFGLNLKYSRGFDFLNGFMAFKTMEYIKVLTQYILDNRKEILNFVLQKK